MKKIGLLSDTHGFLDERVFKHFKNTDEVWHAGDIGTVEVTDRLEKFNPLRAVYGNIDGGILRTLYPKDQIFTCEGVKVYMTHIGGYPGRYARGVKDKLKEHRPDLFICGHSHILKIMRDKQLKLMHMNPGACGKVGFHKVRTLIRFDLNDGEIENPEVIELADKR